MKLKSKIFYCYAALVIVFTLLTLLPTPDKATLIKYHLSASGLRFLTLTLLIPEFAIWLAAFYGYAALQRYSRLIHSAADGQQIAKLAQGLFMLAIGLPVSAIVSSVLAIIASHHPPFQATSVIINNYFAVVFPLLAFWLIAAGARGLTNFSKNRPPYWLQQAVILATLVLGVGFCCLVVLDHAQLRSTYHMSPELVMLTLGIPYMYIWCLGLMGVAELRTYSQKVGGVVYRKGWRLLIYGIGSIVLLSILIQYLSTLSTWLTSLSLGPVLLLLYVLLLLLTAAYIVVALGTKQLRKIEEA
ncbi:MAG TPA: hypothetical protein VLE99_00150 [Candidatus Saccharimonadales bacterium]|nr:hypothetical protein [Candidatus Saccharimonadales bacterium]